MGVTGLLNKVYILYLSKQVKNCRSSKAILWQCIVWLCHTTVQSWHQDRMTPAQDYGILTVMNSCLCCKETVVLLMHWISVLMTNVFFLGRMMVGENNFDTIIFENYWCIHARNICNDNWCSFCRNFDLIVIFMRKCFKFQISHSTPPPPPNIRQNCSTTTCLTFNVYDIMVG